MLNFENEPSDINCDSIKLEPSTQQETQSINKHPQSTYVYW